MKVVIAEEALQKGTGHWPGYVGGIAGGLRAGGDDVEILMHGECRPELAGSLGGTPVFSRNCWLDPRSQGGLGGLRHNFLFRKELKSWLVSQSQSFDYVCALTMRLQHLLAFALLSRDRDIPGKPHFLLLFVQGFGQYAGPDAESQFPGNASTILARFCFRLMAKSVRSGKVILAAETKGMQNELERFTGLPVKLFPHPVPAPPMSAEEPSRGERITLACPGFARHEKGTDLLQEAILQLLDDSELERAFFILQWPDPFNMPDGSLLTPDQRLLDHPRVDFRNKNLNPSEYEGLLQESDIILLPYRRQSYHNRVSRVAIEGAGRGKPLVYMSGTWAAEVADITSAGIPIEEESAEALARAIRKSILDFDILKEKAVGNADEVVRYHSAARFRQLMEEMKKS